MTLQLNAETIEALIRVAAEHYAEGNLNAARQVLEGVVATKLTDARPYKLLGSVYFLQEQHAQAIAHYQEAHRLDPQDPYILVALAELYLITLQLSACIELLGKLKQVDPSGEHPASGRAKMLVERYLQKLGG